MKTKESFWVEVGKLSLAYALMGLAMWWTWTVGNSFINLSLFIYKHLGLRVAFEGACIIYVVHLLAVMGLVYTHITTFPTSRVTPQVRRYRKIALIWALIPGLSMLMPLAVMCWGIVQIGLKGAAFIIVLFETVFKKEEQA